ncbi:MAG: class D beta-lactamase [Maricaulaceae bacterium]|nr:class D beta-lactamase [Maricaulaceae bacterium]
MRLVFAAVISGLSLMSAAHAQELDALLRDAGVTGAVIVHRVSDGREWTGGGARLDERFIPASTFKIPNSLIILQTGVAADPDAEMLVWDGEPRRFEIWNQDQTLRQAFARSTVWAYQEWARRVGHDRMAEWMARLDYGNGGAGGEDDIDRFWLEGPLEISAREQAGFLARLHARDLPFDAEVMETVIAMMVVEEGEGWTLRGKTGWRFGGDPDVGWFAGWAERDGEAWIVALNIDMPEPAAQTRLRVEIARRALALAGAVFGE